MRFIPSVINSIVLSGILCIVSGCGGGADGPELGRVTGTVQLDGEPLEGAVVTFSPVEGGRGSSGVTDASGTYSLNYTHDQQGAILGEHEVRINSASHAGEGADDPLLSSDYNSSTKLKVTVAPGSNSVPFDLKSDGSVASNR